jgi:hypothetical protein
MITMHMDGILNEVTSTVHRRDTSEQQLHTICGVTYNVPEDHLQPVTIEQQSSSRVTDRCGRCFEDGGGY